jgi:hypothetical protein
MVIVVNVADSPLLREPIDRARAEGRAEGRAEAEAEVRSRAEAEARGRAEGKAEAIEIILQQRFPGHVPAGLVEYLAGIDPTIRDEILRKSLTAASVDEALGANAPGKTLGRSR